MPTLALVEEDADADREGLRDLAPQMERYSPIVGLDEDAAAASLYADVTGCAGCFGGEAALLERVGADFGARGWRVQIALADTLGAAWALAHFASEPAPSAATGFCRPLACGSGAGSSRR